MNKLFAPMFLLIAIGMAFANPTYQIGYSAEVVDLGTNRWQYTYEVQNINSSIAIEEFSIYFDYGLYANISSESPLWLASDTYDPTVSQWNEFIWQPSGFTNPGGYDVLALDSGIEAGQTVSGFSVSFDWLGDGTPNSQLYDILDPEFYEQALCSGCETIARQAVIPAPSALFLTLIGLTILKTRYKV